MRSIRPPAISPTSPFSVSLASTSMSMAFAKKSSLETRAIGKADTPDASAYAPSAHTASCARLCAFGAYGLLCSPIACGNTASLHPYTRANAPVAQNVANNPRRSRSRAQKTQLHQRCYEVTHHSNTHRYTSHSRVISITRRIITHTVKFGKKNVIHPITFAAQNRRKQAPHIRFRVAKIF